MRSRAALIALTIGLTLLLPAPALAAGYASPRVAPDSVGAGFSYFESAWTPTTRVFDRYLASIAPSGLVAPVPDDSGSGRRVVYSIETQMVWLIDDHENVLANYLVSGALSRPGPGTYQVFSKSLRTSSFLDPAISMRYMVRFAKTDKTNIGFHDIPTKGGRAMQSLDELGTPLSAGCVRQSRGDAKLMWRWADVGTTVVVTP